LNYYKFIAYPSVSASSHIFRIQNLSLYAQDIQVLVKPKKSASSICDKANFSWNHEFLEPHHFLEPFLSWNHYHHFLEPCGTMSNSWNHTFSWNTSMHLLKYIYSTLRIFFLFPYHSSLSLLLFLSYTLFNT
jgi:hypothetical protein